MQNLKTILITGGARSGKSRYAQERAARCGGGVLFVATAEAGDEDMGARIEQHRQARPKGWRTLEATSGIGGLIAQNASGARVIIVDCITLLVNNIFNRCGNKPDEELDASLLEKEVTAEISSLVECTRQVQASFIIVTNEVGLGIVPANRMGRIYRDLLGKANQVLAERADEVYLMVAGLPLRIKPAGLLRQL